LQPLTLAAAGRDLQEVVPLKSDSVERHVILEEYEGLIAQAESLKDRFVRRDAVFAASAVLERLPISDDLDQNRRSLSHLFHLASDWVMREFRTAQGREGFVTYIDGLIDRDRLDRHVVAALMAADEQDFTGPALNGASQDLIEVVRERIVRASQVDTASNLRTVVDAVLHGDAALFLDGEDRALIISERDYEKRSVGEPETEAVIRGPREGFVESLRCNTALIRRRIRTPQLKVETMRVGRVSRTDVAICYIRNLTPDTIVEEVKRRVQRIDVDAVIDSAMFEELIEDDPYSPFPQVIATERPDIVAANLLEGRLAIIVDGSPFALIVPVTLWSLLQASEDYYERFYIGSFLRILRYALSFLALVGPALYVAVTTFHQEMLPTALLLTVAATREGIPFPSVVEALMMELMFEALREAGVRLPRNVGQAVSIVGALVIGQAAVQAGLVSAPMVIIVAITGIASFSFPRFNLGISVRLLRFPMVLLASTLGLYGIVIGLLIILIHVAGLRSFGVPYTSPVAPFLVQGFRDVIFRPPLWLRGSRSSLLGYLNPRRQGGRIKAGPDPWEGRKDDKER
jgi:Integral membrane protein (PIN domain superfamily)